MKPVKFAEISPKYRRNRTLSNPLPNHCLAQEFRSHSEGCHLSMPHTTTLQYKLLLQRATRLHFL